MACIRDINRLKPQAKKACSMFLDECEKQGLKVLITETLRTKERQEELYAIGRIKPGKIVTWTKQSRHLSGLAWDIARDVKGAEYSDSEFFEACGRVARGLGITWGGDWKNRDMPHFEVGENWGENMEEIEKLRKKLEEIKKKVYHYTADVPDWAVGTVQKLLDRGVYKGSAPDDLNLSEDVMRVLVILDRAGIFDR